MSEPLALYLADNFDAAAGAQLLRERWPGADVVAVPEGHWQARMARKAINGSRYVWLLGVCDTRGVSYDWHAVMPTPDASIVMQVWRTIHEDACTKCSDMGPDIPPVHPEDICDACDGAYPPVVPGPPWHVRYIDDAVTGRFELHESREWSAWAESHEPAKVLEYIAAEWSCSITSLPPVWMLTEGRAILRAREQWVQPSCSGYYGYDDRGRCLAESYARDADDTVSRLRADRDDVEDNIAATLVALQQSDDGRDRLRSERDELRAGLRDALGMVNTEWYGMNARYEALCELAGVDP